MKNEKELKKVAEKIYETGLEYFDGRKGKPQDFQKAEECFIEAANAGNEDAQESLAYMYYSGYGLETNYDKAIFWAEKAANNGCISAQYNLGSMYYDGKGIEQDFQKAFYWYEKAAQAGAPEAQSRVAYLYHKGIGVEADQDKSLYWSDKAMRKAPNLLKRIWKVIKAGCTYWRR